MGRMKTDETIAAIATPAGRGGLGVVRLSGPEAVRIAQQVLRRPASSGEPDPRGGHAGVPGSQTWGAPLGTLSPWRLHLAELPDEQGRIIDRVLVGYFKKPRSYTGEDVVEISCHGSPVVLRFLLDRCLAAGARLAFGRHGKDRLRERGLAAQTIRTSRRRDSVGVAVTDQHPAPRDGIFA